MVANGENLQLIPRLTPLGEVLALIDRSVKTVTPRSLDLAAAVGRCLASDLFSPARPTAAVALADGWAVSADHTIGASGYSPTMLAQMPSRIETGQAMPPETDSVAPFEAVKTFAGYAEALTTINPGDGMLPAGGDCDPATPLRKAGQFLRHTDAAAFASAGISRVTVREPRVRVLPLRGSAIVTAAAEVIAADIERCGGASRLELGLGLDTAMVSNNFDALVAIGGTGSGRYDNSVQMLARLGRLAVHGVALSPGETAAFGFAGERPVLLLPGRLDAALAVWLVVGRALLARLSAGKIDAPRESLSLARKVTSTVGLAELIPVRREGDNVEPMASRYLALSVLSRADGWILVPAESEGYPAGAAVDVRAWP